MVQTGDPVVELSALGSDVDAVYVNASVGNWGRRRDAEVAAALASEDVEVIESWGTLVTEPGSVLTRAGTLSRVFTPFFRAWTKTPLTSWPSPGDAELITVSGSHELPLVEAPRGGAGPTAAHDRLQEWVEHVDDYERTRDIPAVGGTSMLSSDLRFGTLSPRTVLNVVGESTSGRAAFVRQLAWRDWYAHLMVEYPDMATKSIRQEYDGIEWVDDDAGFEAWTHGRTGYPIVDAGMRQLAQTGWMHNRVRMITASFLVKDLLIDWRRGERWFRRHLLDGDPAQNAGNWQWVAGTGPDAAPYFRVFNPITQSRRFDPDGMYLRRWIPEIAGLDSALIHAPWEVGSIELATAGVVLGDTYPEPIIDHGFARERTLAAYEKALGK